MKNCNDEASADNFVQECQKLCDQVYKGKGDLSQEQETQLVQRVKHAMLYRVGKIDHCLCNCCFVKKFEG